MTEQTQGRQQRVPSVLVAVLHTGQIRWELAAWLTWLVASEKRGRVMIKFFGGDLHAHPVNSNRNRILKDTPRDFDAVLMIDEDTVPHPHTIEVAYLACPEEVGGMGLDVVLAPTPVMRTDDERGPVMTNLVPLGAEAGSHDHVTLPVGANTLLEIKEGGTGVCAIARRVIDHPEMRAPFQFEYDDDGMTIVGEDHFFCRRARAAGFKVYGAMPYPQGHVKPIDLKSVYEMYRPGPPRQPALVVTGTGRCGTGFAANWLSSAGLRCGHEALFMYRGYDAALKRAAMFSMFRADASWMAAPYLDNELLQGVPVIHQIRHPAKVLASWVRKATQEHTPRYWTFLLEHCPEIGEIEQPVDQFAARYVLWNEMIEAKLDGDRPRYSWRVEDGEAGLMQWLTSSGILDFANVDKQQLFPDHSYNHKSGPGPDEIELDEIGEPWRSRIAAMAQRYGYGW